jgi:phosphate transport system ATP-binding protein
VEPEFILADEATSALDPISSKHIEDLFLELKQNYAIVLVTHTLQQALRFAVPEDIFHPGNSNR